MSKGLGKLQKRLIDISTASKTIFQASPDGIRMVVADITEKTSCGITTIRMEGTTWRTTGEPYFCADVIVQSHDHFKELKANFRAVFVTDRNPPDPMLSACWSMHHIRAVLWPELWKPGDNREEIPLPSAPWMNFPQIPAAIKKERNAAQAGLSRAIKSMETRHMLIHAGTTESVAAQGIWKCHGGTAWRASSWHVLSCVLDPQLVHA